MDYNNHNINNNKKTVEACGLCGFVYKRATGKSGNYLVTQSFPSARDPVTKDTITDHVILDGWEDESLMFVSRQSSMLGCYCYMPTM